MSNDVCVSQVTMILPLKYLISQRKSYAQPYTILYFYKLWRRFHCTHVCNYPWNGPHCKHDYIMLVVASAVFLIPFICVLIYICVSRNCLVISCKKSFQPNLNFYEYHYIIDVAKTKSFPFRMHNCMHANELSIVTSGYSEPHICT